MKSVSIIHSANERKPIVWSIAGSDSGGGAGIQADIATIVDLHCHPCTVISSITAQNTVSVAAIEATSDGMFEQQLTALQNDLLPDVIKIGLLVNQRQVDSVARCLVQLKRINLNVAIPVILDPVMVASCGDTLSIQKLDLTSLKGLITIITPNTHELKQLVDTHSISFLPLRGRQSSQQLLAEYGRGLARHLGCNVLITGGDRNDTGTQVQDIYVTQCIEGASERYNDSVYCLSSNKQSSQHNHGTGCTLSTAMACFLAKDYVLHDAVVMAKAYVSHGLELSYANGAGKGCLARTGWPNTLEHMPYITMLSQSVKYASCSFKPLAKAIGVYPVVDSFLLLKSLLEANCTTVQLRIKSHDSNYLRNEINRSVTLAKQYDAQLFINDHWQLAIECGAFGVHLGQEDLAQADLCAIQSAGLALGVSSHSYFEVLIARQCRPSYIALGHIFDTQTKSMPSSPQGVEKLQRYSQLLTQHYLTVAIGGINQHNLARVAHSGVDSVAMVSAICNTHNPGQTFQQLSQVWQQYSHASVHVKSLSPDTTATEVSRVS